MIAKSASCFSTSFALFSAILIGCAGCDGRSPPDGTVTVGGNATPRVTSIAITPSGAGIAIAQTQAFTAQAQDQNGVVMSGVTFTWNSSNASVASVADGVATGVAAGTVDITASSGGVTSNAAALTVAPTAAEDFHLLPTSIKLSVDAQSTLLAVTPPGVPAWTSSDPSVATVDMNGQVTAIAKGSAVITARSGTASASSNVKVFRTSGANPDMTSADLIAQALALGTISSEQALVYRVFALFGDARLPSQYDGAPGLGPDHMLMRDVQTQLPTLSQSTQDILNAFLVPPIYTQSALAQQLGAPLAAAKQSGINCSVAAGPSAYRRVSVATADAKFTFNVFYFPLHGGDVDPQQKIAEQIAAVALEVYDAETRLFALFPKSDGGLPCNGGDAGIDIYLTPMNELKLAGQTTAYSAQCSNTASFIQLNLFHPIFFIGTIYPKDDARSAIKSVVAHELLHVLQFSMSRQASCQDTKWFDEATAEWAMDFVEPKFPQTAIGAPGLEDGLFDKVSTSKRRSGQFYAEYLYSGHLHSLEKGLQRNFGYADYLFFQYLARSQSPAAIKQIYDAMAAGKDSVEAIGAAVDMTAIWPEFSKTLWNDVTDHVLDYWQKEDDYDFGLADVFAHPGAVQGAGLSDLQPLEIDQKGKQDEIFTLLDNALEHSVSGDYEIAPRSMIYEQLKFTDPTVHTATFTNPVAGDPDNQYVKVWVVKKVGGKWSSPEDWTQQPSKAFCLDKKDERLEQLLVIVSNSEVNPDTEAPYRISLRAPMQVATTNVGCWRWEGTASLTTHSIDGPVTVESATATFDQYRSTVPDLPDAGLSLGYIVFGTFINSSASYSISGFNTPLGCTITGSANAAMQPYYNGPVLHTDGDLIVNFGLPDPLHRAVIGGGRTLITGVAETYVCSGQTEVITSDKTVQWLALPQPPTEVAPTISADGQSFTGRWQRTDADGDKVSLWDFHAVREQ